ncbi:hypothetical protein cyc_01422 [Cyclospora cayetanensis]|uniref:Uncharacterized protein n=1 Tax=Cyclospora cayetanensis TaxID=88456 RepID=A0A1D3D8P4_9EIME|nr:hypothetical protein cyc_01422 [Cyclospora cayetanensis]
MTGRKGEGGHVSDRMAGHGWRVKSEPLRANHSGSSPASLPPPLRVLDLRGVGPMPNCIRSAPLALMACCIIA